MNLIYGPVRVRAGQNASTIAKHTLVMLQTTICMIACGNRSISGSMADRACVAGRSLE
jgi:hypothetical protein